MKNVFYAICAAIFIGVILWAFLPHLLAHTPTFIDKKFIVDCPKVSNSVVTITISNNGFSPQITHATVCDKIVFKNIENKAFYQIAFGDHPTHLVYPGFTEKVLGPGQENSFLATAYGTYKIHDHIRDKIEGEIIIAK